MCHHYSKEGQGDGTHLCNVIQINGKLHLFPVCNVGELLCVCEHLSIAITTLSVELCQEALDLVCRGAVKWTLYTMHVDLPFSSS